jgi:hypothetical protein
MIALLDSFDLSRRFFEKNDWFEKYSVALMRQEEDAFVDQWLLQQ